MDINKHRLYLFRLLKDIYENKKLGEKLGFKGGTALMFFYDLPRFSVDLDFNLLPQTDPNGESRVFEEIRGIVEKHGTIYDEAIKHYGIICMLDYGLGERKLKVEISNRNFGDRYEIKNLFGLQVNVMVQEDMFAHKLCTLLDRPVIAHRDIFDCWFFMNRKTPLNPFIVERRMKLPLADYLQKCILALERLTNRNLLSGLGELVNPDMKEFIRTKLCQDCIEYLRFYRQFPILASNKSRTS